MCGRFVSSSSSDEIATYFGADEVSESALDPNYNVAPTRDVYAVLEQRFGVGGLEEKRSRKGEDDAG